MNSQNEIYIPEEEGIDIKKYIFLIISHWWWFAIALSISLTIAYLINRYSQEVYSASCSIIIGEYEGGAGSVESILDELARAKGKRRKAVVENEITILKSYKMARLALEELDFDVTYAAIGRRNIAENQLYRDCPFKVVMDTANKSSLLGTYYLTFLPDKKFLLGINEESQQEHLFGEVIKIGDNNFKVILREPESYSYNSQRSNKYYFTVNNMNSLARAYSNVLEVNVNADKGSILTLSMSGLVPGQITDYLNKLAEVYISINLEDKNLTSENTIRFIDAQLRGVVDSLEATGLRLQQFRSDNKVINLGKEGAFLFEKMQDMQSERAAFDIKERYYNYLLEYIKKKADFSDVVAPSVIGIQDMLLNSLVAELNELNLQRRNLSLSVVDNSPQASILKNQIVNTKNALLENLVSLVEGNNIAITELNERIRKIEKEVQKLPGTERQLINIEREFTINDQIYTFLLQKRAEAGITKASNTSDHNILDVARPENTTKIKPKSSLNYMIAMAAGGMLPLALLLIIEFFNTKITDRKFLETNLKAPIIGTIGHNETGIELPLNENPRSSFSESFRAIRTNLQYLLKDSDSKVIAVSSAVSGEGKTFCSINLASIIAMAGKKTLLVGLDLRKPKVYKVFNLDNKIGMSTFLIGKNSFGDIMSESNIKNLYIATSGPIPPNPSELISSDKMHSFIREARTKFDYIILDTPPVAIVTDMLTLKDVLDALVFVIRHNFSDKHVVDLANTLYEKHLVANTGVIVNDILIKGYYGYSYRGGYSYHYGENYYSDITVKKNFIKALLKK